MVGYLILTPKKRGMMFALLWNYNLKYMSIMFWYVWSVILPSFAMNADGKLVQEGNIWWACAGGTRGLGSKGEEKEGIETRGRWVLPSKFPWFHYWDPAWEACKKGILTRGDSSCTCFPWAQMKQPKISVSSILGFSNAYLERPFYILY